MPLFILSFDLCFTGFEDPREGGKNNCRRDKACRKIRDALGHIDALISEEMGENKAERNEDYYFAGNGEYQSGPRLTQSDVNILESHLHEEHDRPHQEERAIAPDDLGDSVAGREDIGIDLGDRKGHGPYGDGEYKRDYCHILYAGFKLGGIALAVIVADEGLHTVAEAVKGEGNKLQSAEHHGESGGAVLCADKHRAHREEGAALCQNIWVKSLGQHHENRAAGSSFPIKYIAAWGYLQ